MAENNGPMKKKIKEQPKEAPKEQPEAPPKVEMKKEEPQVKEEPKEQWVAPPKVEMKKEEPQVKEEPKEQWVAPPKVEMKKEEPQVKEEPKEQPVEEPKGERIKFEKENFYHIIADTGKNRIYMKIYGIWRNSADVPNYNTNMEKAVKYMKRGFTACVTLDEDKPPRFGMTKLHKKQQDTMLAAGNIKTAVHLPGKQLLQQMTLNVVGKLSGMAVKTFKTIEDAEVWLDS